MVGRIPDIFFAFEFQKDRLKMWEQWGSNFGLFHWLGTSLIQQLVATAQALINCWNSTLILFLCISAIFYNQKEMWPLYRSSKTRRSILSCICWLHPSVRPSGWQGTVASKTGTEMDRRKSIARPRGSFVETLNLHRRPSDCLCFAPSLLSLVFT